MEESLTEGVRAACKALAEGASFVRIERDLAPSYAASLPLEQATAPALDPDRHYFGDRDDTVAYFLPLDAINFGSGYFPHLRKRPGMSGYFTVASSLTDYYRERGPLRARELTRLTAEDCTRIFAARSPAKSPLVNSWGISPGR